MIQPLFLLVSLSFVSFIQAQTYTTLTNGSWNNTTNVWSTDGVTPCLCDPPETINGFNVEIYHPIVLSGDIQITGAADTLIIRNGGALNNSIKAVTVTSGKLFSESNGQMNIKEFIVGVNGEANLSGDIVSDKKWSIDGMVTLQARATIVTGNFEIKGPGTVNLLQGTVIDILIGNLLNDGDLNMDSVCINIVNGNFENKTGSSVLGIGKITTLLGDIDNNSIWSVNVFWCAFGSDSGMPTVENCILSCSTILPIELLGFEVNKNDDAINITWTTATEINNDYFTIECSRNGYDFMTVMTVMGAGNSNAVLEYSVTDYSPFNGVSYYRLKQTDYDGKFSYSKIIGIEMNGIGSNITLFPNPVVDGVLNIVGNGVDDEEILVVLYNMLGEMVYSKVVWTHNNGFTMTVDVKGKLSSSIYLVVGTSKYHNEIFRKKLIVRE